MPFLKFNNVGITGISAAVPANIVKNFDYTQFFTKEEAVSVSTKIGVFERRFSPSDLCASDLSFAAAERLISDLNIDRSDIGLLVFVSQTSDYRMPATSTVLQGRLGLSNRTMAFDVGIACSGFVNTLSVMYSLMNQPDIKKALLLIGETRSKVYSPKDRSTAFLFGDAGAAILIERGNNFGPSYFSLNTDGTREDLIKVKAGGYRFPSNANTFIERVIDEHGNIRSDEHGYMNGPDVFNFVLREIPRDIQSLLDYSCVDIKSIDYFLLHQANLFVNKYLINKMKLDTTKVPFSIAKFGNTSSVSIPLTIVSELNNDLVRSKRILMSGFGAGMSWASAIIDFDKCNISQLVEV